MSIAFVPRNSPMVVGGRVSIDWDRWFQSIAQQLNALAVVLPQGPYADPNGNVVASPGALYTTAAGGVNVTLWVKESGVNTDLGWVSK